jgi:hypothetical protein
MLKAQTIFEMTWNKFRSARCIPGQSLLPLPAPAHQHHISETQQDLTISIVISILKIRRVGILGSEKIAAQVAIRIKYIMVGISRFIVMQSPDVDEDHGSLWKELALYPFI